MKIKTIGSGSSGNCYLIDDGQTQLLLECGLPIKKIKAGCDYDFSRVAGCLITHEHGDHAKAANDLMRAGVDVWMTEGAARAAGADVYRLKLFKRIRPNDCYFTETIGTFTILAFPVHHDAAEPVGYLIHSGATDEKLLYVTDTQYIDYRFRGLTHIMVEANFSSETLADPDNDPRRHRLRRTHMSIENTLKMLQANDLSKCKRIYLIHLSQTNADAEEFVRRVETETGVPTSAA